MEEFMKKSSNVMMSKTRSAQWDETVDVVPLPTCPMDDFGMSSLPTFLPTNLAAKYCGYKSAGGLRKAYYEGKVFPVGRRGGQRTWMWSVKALDAFCKGEQPSVTSVEQSGKAGVR
jgi:hypothetical protein